MPESPKYHYVGSVQYQPVKPSPHENLMEVYGLSELVKKVGRIDEHGNKRKMRRSYKAYIQDLPGHNEIIKDDTLKQWLANPIMEDVAVDEEQLIQAFSHVQPGILPGFNPKVFGLDDDAPMGPGSRDSSQPKSPVRSRRP
ncbi:mediator complex subunit Med19 [Schizosaccharomyces osmophilus]|uniref:Mediator of RNA polymerase II transcription subunit 19 n=1 Tax=Schizosaccharomyces osmophilus TaxID=2545709 RepID=A0AAE9WHF0_9SCHI|nr:mediator complex subunit Med19 [Schizosaccharomyces osmophilus]WBW74603.1 mediator complex subunit Med19 [Schizosaccharomyces osmophilus]